MLNKILCKKQQQDSRAIAFLDYCKDGILDLVQTIYEAYAPRGALLIARDDDGKTALHMAAYYGHDDVLEYLILEAKECQLHMDPIDNLGFTPLLYACFRGYDDMEEDAVQDRIKCVKMLVEADADLNFRKSTTFLTPLHWAAFNEDKNSVLYLLQNGAILQRGFNLHTPLDIAGICDNKEIVETILLFWFNKNKNGDKKYLSEPSQYTMNEKTLRPSQVSPGDLESKDFGHKKVKLRYDNPKVELTEPESIIYDIMFWAAGLGLNQIVDLTIQMGYSPFYKTFDSQNALMAAVERGHEDTVKLILSYSYESFDPVKFEKLKCVVDKNGNTPLHLAFKRVHQNIATILDEKFPLMKEERNLRGLLPDQMCHKKIKGKQNKEMQDAAKSLDQTAQLEKKQKEDWDIDDEPDYVFYVNQLRAPLLTLQLQDLNIDFREFRSALNESMVIIVIYFSNELLDQMAEIYGLPVRLLDENQAIQFKDHAEENYEQFQARQKQFLMMKVFEQEIDIDYYTKNGVIVDHFPLHDKFKETIATSWEKYRFKLFFGFITGRYKHYFQPIHFIASYYGEKQGFYFAWHMFYTSWLMIPAIPGLALFIYQMVMLVDQNSKNEVQTLDNPYNCLYCLILAVWSTVFYEIWKRKESEIAYLWNMTNYQGADTEMPDYRADYIIDEKQKAIRKENLANSYIRRVFGETPSATISVGIVILCFWGYRLFSTQNKSNPSFSVGSSVVNAIVIVVLDILYKKLADILVKWENHRYQEDWENSMISKHFAFKFVNAYIALFSVAFADQNFNLLAQNLAIILAAKRLATGLINITGPKIQVWWRLRKLNKALASDFKGKQEKLEDQKVQEFVERQLQLQPQSNVLVAKYSEIIIQFGYIVLFAQAFPLAPLLSIFINFLEMKADMNMMAFYQKRTVAQGATGIGSWGGIVETLSFVGIGVNCGIIYWTSDSLNVILEEYDYDETQKFMIVNDEEEYLYELLDKKADDLRAEKDVKKLPLEDKIKIYKDKLKAQQHEKILQSKGSRAIFNLDEMRDLLGDVEPKYNNQKSKKRSKKLTLYEVQQVYNDEVSNVHSKEKNKSRREIQQERKDRKKDLLMQRYESKKIEDMGDKGDEGTTYFMSLKIQQQRRKSQFQKPLPTLLEEQQNFAQNNEKFINDPSEHSNQSMIDAEDYQINQDANSG
eukprot:403372059